jgi:hypothetical protein
MRWSDMTDLARRVWLKRRAQRRQSAESAAESAHAAGEEAVSVSRKRRRDESDAEGGQSCGDIVGFVGSEAGDRPEFAQLGGFSTLSFLYDRVWDERRAAAAQPAAAAAAAARPAAGDGEPRQQQAVWRKLTLYYALQEVDDAGRPLRLESGAEDEPTRRQQQPQLTHAAMQPRPPASPSLQPQRPSLSFNAADSVQDGM